MDSPPPTLPCALHRGENMKSKMDVMEAPRAGQRACHETDTQTFERKRGTHREGKKNKRAGSVLVEDDFLVTCLGGASERRAGRITRSCIVCNGLNGECSVCIGVCFCFSHLL